MIEFAIIIAAVILLILLFKYGPYGIFEAFVDLFVSIFDFWGTRD